MEGPARLAVIGDGSNALCDALRLLPQRPEVQAWRGLYTDPQELLRWGPAVMFWLTGSGAAEHRAAVRLWQQLLPAAGLVLVGNELDERVLAPLAQELGARVLLQPFTPVELAAVLAQALTGSDRPGEDVFLDLSRGLADEINNPLMYVSGHLQLLRAALDPQRETDRLGILEAAMQGLGRIQATVERLRLLSTAASGPRRGDEVDLGALLDALRGEAAPALLREPAAGPFVIGGDAALLRQAFAGFLKVIGELRGDGTEVHLELVRLPAAVRLRAVLSGANLAGWRLPRTFEPYYVNRVLRGTTAGLDLFLAQVTVLAHRGEALARRLPGGSLLLDLVLPATPA